MNMNEGGVVTFKLSDFGTFCAITEVARERPVDSGDGMYQPPEFQDEEKPARELIDRADIFSLGWTAYEMATFRTVPPSTRKWLGEVDPSVHTFFARSAELQSLILRMIDPDVRSRPSASTLLQEVPHFERIIDARIASGRYTPSQQRLLRSQLHPAPRRLALTPTKARGGNRRVDNNGRSRLSLGRVKFGPSFSPSPLSFDGM